MEWTQVYGSSNVDAIQYDPDTKECRVRFHKGGQVYVYSGVEEAVFNQLLHSESKGRFVQIVLRRGYSYRKEG